MSPAIDRSRQINRDFLSLANIDLDFGAAVTAHFILLSRQGRAGGDAQALIRDSSRRWLNCTENLSLPFTSPTPCSGRRSGFITEAQAPARYVVKMSLLLVEAWFRAIRVITRSSVPRL